MTNFFRFKVKLFTMTGFIIFLLLFAGCAYMELEGLDSFMEKEVISFEFSSSSNSALSINITGSISSGRITMTVPYGTDITSLVPDISFVGSSISPSAGSAQDFTNPVTYTVTAENGTSASYQVEVQVDNTTNDLLSFNFYQSDNTNDLSSDYYGVINQDARTISFTVPFNTNVGGLVPTVLINGASVLPASNTPVNFSSSPVNYTVYAGDTTPKVYAVTVNIAPNTAKEITDFRFTAANNPGVIFGADVTSDINQVTRVISVTVPYNTELDSLRPNITTTGNSVTPDETVFRNFGSSLTYRVTAADTSFQDYTVNVTVAPNTDTDIVLFDFLDTANSEFNQDLSGDIDLNIHTVTIYVPDGTNVTDLTPDITLPADAGVVPASGESQDFSSPVNYRVTPGLGAFQDYAVSVVVDQSPTMSDNKIAFSNITATSVDLSWNAANDDRTAASNLEYKVVYSTAADILSSEQTGLETGLEWSVNDLSETISDLTTDNWNYFNVFVRDEIGNVSLYESIYIKISTGYSGASVYSFTGDCTDSSPNGYDLILAGALDLRTDRDGNPNSAIRLYNPGAPGSYVNYLYYGNQTIFDYEDELTISVWINFTDVTTNQKVLGNAYVEDPNPDPAFKTGYVMGIENSQLCVAFWTTDPADPEKGANFSSPDIVPDTWIHLAMTYQRNGLIRAYVNGSEVGNISVGGDYTIKQSLSRYMSIGIAPWNFATREGIRDGLVDDIRIMGTALSDTEIANLANMSADQ